MPHKSILIDRTPDGNGQKQSDAPNNDTDRIRETVVQTQQDAQRIRQQLDQHIENCTSSSRGVHVLWVSSFWWLSA